MPEKRDNVQTLVMQRTEAREEIARIQRWVFSQPMSAWGRTSMIAALGDKLDYLRNKVLREDA